MLEMISKMLATKTSLLYMGGVKNAKVAVVTINDSINHVNAQSIENISNYHSAEFQDDKIKFWNFFEIGLGKEVSMKEVDFKSGLKVISDFDDATINTCYETPKKKPRLDRVRNDEVKVCSEPNCVKSFMCNVDLEQHQIKGDHTYNLTGMDNVKQLYIGHVVSNAASSSSSSTDVLSSSNFSAYFVKGWALPKRKHTRFTFKQLKYVYDAFMLGENTGQKSTPEDIVMKMRCLRANNKKHFMSNEYLRVSQVKSLFSRYARQKRDGSLKEPKDSAESLGTVDESQDDLNYDDGALLELEELKNTLVKEVCAVGPNCDDWVLVRYENSIFLGSIVEIKDDEYKVTCMHEAGINSFKWPSRKDVCWYDNIITIIDAPEPINSRGLYKLNVKDFGEYKEYVKNT